VGAVGHFQETPLAHLGVGTTKSTLPPNLDSLVEQFKKTGLCSHRLRQGRFCVFLGYLRIALLLLGIELKGRIVHLQDVTSSTIFDKEGEIQQQETAR
jgi:nucleotidyltransferase/DNA polymerase involved in DNA repair